MKKKEIGDLFGIKQNEVTGFLKTITHKMNIQEIEDVFKLRDSFPVPLRSNLLNILTAYEDNDAMSSYLQLIGMQNIYKSQEKLLQVVSEFKDFYEAIKNIITKKGLDSKHGISSEYNKFILLDKLMNVKQPDAKEVTLLENYWSIKTGSGKAFLEKAKTALEGKELLQEFCMLLNNVTFATRQEISKHLEAQKVIHPIAGACALYLFLDTPNISDVLHKLYQFDKQVVDAIEKVEFFASTEQENAAQFLANTLIYQKYFRTIVKFSAFREHNGEITSSINIFDKGKISLTNTFSSGLKRDGKLLGLGSGGDYGEIAKILKNVQLRLQLDNTKLVDSIKEILKGKNLYATHTTTDHDAVKTLYDIVYLLFSLEVNRNPSALLTNAIFFELVLKGEFSLDDMPKKMPMAMKGAVAVSRKYRDNSERNKKLANDYGEAEEKEGDFSTFKGREKELFDRYTLGATDKTSLFSKLINDWYGIVIKNSPTLKGLEDSDKTPIAEISQSFYEYTLESLSELLELILKNEGLSHVPVLPSKYVFIEVQEGYDSQTQDLQLRKLLSNVEAKLSNHQNGDIVLSPINMNNEHAVGLIFARQHKHSNPSEGNSNFTSPDTNNITAYYIDPANKPIPAGLQKVLHDNGYRVEQLPAQQQISTNCGSELVANFKLYLTGDRFKQKEEIIAQNKLYENSLKQGQPSNVEYGSGTLDKVVDTIDPLRLTQADALSLSTLVENLISALETESVDLANSSPILLSPKQEARELWKKQQEKDVLKNVLNLLQQEILFPVSVEPPKLVSEKEEAQNAYYGASIGTVGMGGVLQAISQILANTPKLVLFAGATGLAASICGGNYLENLQQELVGEFAKSDLV